MFLISMIGLPWVPESYFLLFFGAGTQGMIGSSFLSSNFFFGRSQKNSWKQNGDIYWNISQILLFLYASVKM